MSSSPTAPTPPLEGAKSLQERLNQLLSNLSSSIEIVKTWPSTDGDDASIHVKTTSKLIVAVWEILKALEKVEGTIKADAELRKALQNCPIPVNLLDLLDHGNGLNPDCFSRGLLRESMGQLAGLKRRKLALEMLGAAVQAGLSSRVVSETNAAAPETSNKRQRSAENENLVDVNETEVDGPITKKSKTEAE